MCPRHERITAVFSCESGMALNGKNGGFFLDLDSSDAKPVTLDLGPDNEPEETTPEAPSSPMTLTVSKADDSAPSSEVKGVQDSNASTSSAPAATATPAKPAQAKPSLTTAEAIAAELAAAEAARPTASLTTFAPDNLVPGKALRQRRRRPGSNLKGFKSMAGDLFKN